MADDPNYQLTIPQENISVALLHSIIDMYNSKYVIFFLNYLSMFIHKRCNISPNMIS